MHCQEKIFGKRVTCGVPGDGPKPRYWLALEGLSAAYEVHDLQVIAVGKLGLWPVLAGDNVVIQFDGDSIGFHTHIFDERGEGQGRVKIANFTIDFDVHLMALTRAYAGGTCGWRCVRRSWPGPARRNPVGRFPRTRFLLLRFRQRR